MNHFQIMRFRVIVAKLFGPIAVSIPHFQLWLFGKISHDLSKFFCRSVQLMLFFAIVFG